MNPSFLSRCSAALLVATLSAAGCASRNPASRGTTVALSLPAEVSGGNASDLQRALDETPPGSPERATLRDRVARYLAQRGVEAAQTGDFQTALARLRAALVHHTPDELASGALPDELGPLARAVLENASSRGDEAHSLAAARVLMALRTPDPEARATFERISEWGSRNRQDFQRPWVRAGELADIYKEVARIVPARDILEQTATYIIERRRAAMEARSLLTPNSPQGPRLNFDELRQLQAGVRNSGPDLAFVFLRVGDVTEAANRLTSLGQGESSALASALGAIAHGEGGADALWELAERLDPIDSAASAGVCRDGRQRFTDDARFARGLAVAATRENDMGLASAHLERAATLSSRDQRTLHDAIGASILWLQREIGADDLRAGRRAYARATSLIERWRTQYPGQTPPIATADLEEAAAQHELSAGNLDEARVHLERATHAEPASRDAFYTLAEIAWRHNDATEAARQLQAGMALPLRPSESDSIFRPVYTVRMAQAAQESNPNEARRLFEESSTSLEALARSTTGQELATTQMQRAIVFDALGQPARAKEVLREALDASPENRDIAGRAVTFALSRGMWSDARDLYRLSRAQLNLDRPWQIYFGLWGVMATRLGRLDDDAGALHLIESMAATGGPMSPWTVRLAQRFTGAIDREQLLRYARTTGQRAEALFYDAMLKLAAGDADGAETDLRAVLSTETLHYFEYEMAWEMLKRHVRPASATAAPVRAPSAQSAQRVR
jgi:tetratricopeptide (TPR) repeat protein